MKSLLTVLLAMGLLCAVPASAHCAGMDSARIDDTGGGGNLEAVPSAEEKALRAEAEAGDAADAKETAKKTAKDSAAEGA